MKTCLKKFVLVLRETEQGRVHKFFGGPYGGIAPRVLLLKRAWTRGGRPVVTCEGVYWARNEPRGSGVRQVFDLETGYGKLSDGLRERIWFAPVKLQEGTLDLEGVRQWWLEEKKRSKP